MSRVCSGEAHRIDESHPAMRPLGPRALVLVQTATNHTHEMDGQELTPVANEDGMPRSLPKFGPAVIRGVGGGNASSALSDLASSRLSHPSENRHRTGLTGWQSCGDAPADRCPTERSACGTARQRGRATLFRGRDVAVSGEPRACRISFILSEQGRELRFDDVGLNCQIEAPPLP